MAALASRREYLNLDKWLADNVASHGAEFLHAVIEFLESKMESEKTTRISDPAIESRTMTLNPLTITIFLRVLRNKYVPILHHSHLLICLSAQISCALVMLTIVWKFETHVFKFTPVS